MALSFKLSCRQFVTSMLAAGGVQASQKATARSGMRSIVDVQVHLWKAESEDWKWVRGMKPAWIASSSYHHHGQATGLRP